MTADSDAWMVVGLESSKAKMLAGHKLGGALPLAKRPENVGPGPLL